MINFDKVQISAATLIKIAVPSITLIIGGTTLYNGLQAHMREDKKRDMRLTQIECTIGLKTGYECQFAAVSSMFDMIAPAMDAADAMALEETPADEIVLDTEPQG